MTSPPDPTPALLNTPYGIWETIKKTGGLDLEYHRDMDEDVVQSLRKGLGIAGAVPLDTALRDPALTVERFMGALLEALNPFSAMLSDLLAMFEQAGARRTDHALQIDFDFGDAPRLSFDLRQFRDWLEQMTRVREIVRVRRWAYRDLWDLSALLRGDRRGSSRIADRWVEEYYDGRWPEHVLPAPQSGDPVLDAALGKAYRVWSTVVKESAKFGPVRRELHERGFRIDESRQEGETGWSMRFLAQVDHDNWAGSLAAGMYAIAEHAQMSSDPNGGMDTDDIVAAIDALFARVPSMDIEEEAIRKVLIEFLNLPIWQRRHELYSAWIMTLIADALSDRNLRFHPVDGLLSFSFGGSHLATAEATMPHLHVWTELRSPLEEPSELSGRENIQPDYTLIADPISSPKSAVVVVECKQYRRFSKKNFSHAVIDYATGRPNAHVVLAAYGPVRDDFLTELDSAMAARITLLGHLRPGDVDARTHFRTIVRSALPEPSVDERTDAPASIPIARKATQTLRSIRLSWRDQPRDLDLHLGVWHAGNWANIDFNTKGSLTEFPWALLQEDVTTGHGPETITITNLLDATYRCFVFNYSAERDLANCEATIEITYRDSLFRLTCPTSGTGRYWHVFDLDVPRDQLVVVNTIVATDVIVREI